MPKTRPVASLVVLCHDDGEYLKTCLDAVYLHTRDVPFEVLLVDNASGPETRAVVDAASRRPGLRVIRNAENRFFAGGNNQGIEVSSGRYVVLLNADAVPGPGWLSGLIRCAEREPSIGLVAPCTNEAAGVQRVADPAYRSLSDFPRFAQAWARERAGRWREAHRLIAFCLLLKREVLERVGLLDERFGPGGYEDYDYCLRARQAGYRLALAEDVFVHHFGGKGYAGMDYSAQRRVNRELLARKWTQFALHALDDADAWAREGKEAPMPETYKPAPNAAWRRVDDEVVVLDLNTSAYYSFTGVGARLWELLAESLPPEEVARRIVEEYDAEEKVVAKDLKEFLKELKDEKLLLPV